MKRQEELQEFIRKHKSENFNSEEVFLEIYEFLFDCQEGTAVGENSLVKEFFLMNIDFDYESYLYWKQEHERKEYIACLDVDLNNEVYAVKPKKPGIIFFDGVEMPILRTSTSFACNGLYIFQVKIETRGEDSKISYQPFFPPIFPSAILKNSDTGYERVELTFFKYGEWVKCVVDRLAISDNSAIVKILSPFGVDVNSSNAKKLVAFLGECLSFNQDVLKPKRSISRLGWSGMEFSPYSKKLFFDFDSDFDSVRKSFSQAGDFEKWKTGCSSLRKNKIIRLAQAASVASVLLEPLGILPFIFHMWGTLSGSGKTVALMVAASIWGNPGDSGLLSTANGTKNFIMRKSAFLKNLPFFADELQTIKSEYRGNFDDLIYTLSEGIDRGRAKASGGVESVKTWRLCFLFNGEEPITKSDSRAGSLNRVVEINIKEPIINDGFATVELVKNNYGFAGGIIVGKIQETGVDQLKGLFQKKLEQFLGTDVTEKQRQSAAVLLLADELLVSTIFNDEKNLTANDILKFLRKNDDVDISEKAFDEFRSWIAGNPYRFEEDAEELPKCELWGRFPEASSKVVFVRKDCVRNWFSQSAFDFDSCIKSWQDKGYMIRSNTNSGRWTHQTTLAGIKTTLFKFNIELMDDIREPVFD